MSLPSHQVFYIVLLSEGTFYSKHKMWCWPKFCFDWFSAQRAGTILELQPSIPTTLKFCLFVALCVMIWPEDDLSRPLSSIFSYFTSIVEREKRNARELDNSPKWKGQAGRGRKAKTNSFAHFIRLPLPQQRFTLRSCSLRLLFVHWKIERPWTVH